MKKSLAVGTSDFSKGSANTIKYMKVLDLKLDVPKKLYTKILPRDFP